MYFQLSRSPCLSFSVTLIFIQWGAVSKTNRPRPIAMNPAPCRSKTHKMLKRMLFNWTKQDKMHKFSRKSSHSKLCRSTTHTHKKKNQLIHSSFASWILGWERKKEGTRPFCLVLFNWAIFHDWWCTKKFWVRFCFQHCFQTSVSLQSCFEDLLSTYENDLIFNCFQDETFHDGLIPRETCDVIWKRYSLSPPPLSHPLFLSLVTRLPAPNHEQVGENRIFCSMKLLFFYEMFNLKPLWKVVLFV